MSTANLFISLFFISDYTMYFQTAFFSFKDTYICMVNSIVDGSRCICFFFIVNFSPRNFTQLVVVAILIYLYN